MTAQELHIDLDYHVQKINSNATRNIEPREKDWLLNEQVNLFVNKRTRDISDPKQRGFQEDSKRLKDIQNLICNEDIIVSPSTLSTGRFILPSNVFKYIRVDCNMFKECEASEFKKNSKRIKLSKFKFPRFEEGVRFIVSVNIDKTSKSIFDTNNLPSTYLKNNYFYLLKAFNISLKDFLDNNEDCDISNYFEFYDNKFINDTYFFETPLEYTFQVSIIEDSPSKGVVAVEESFIDKVYYTSNKEFQSQGRVLNEENQLFRVKYHLSKSTQESPLVSLEKGFGEVFFPNNTIIKNVSYVYVCKPNLIDIHLNKGLNFSREVCEEIIIQTARFIKGLFDSNNYEKYLNETRLIE